jgi:thioredoxin
MRPKREVWKRIDKSGNGERIPFPARKNSDFPPTSDAPAARVVSRDLKNFRDETLISSDRTVKIRRVQVMSSTIIACRQCGTKNRVEENAARERQAVCGKCGAALDAAQADSNIDTSHPRVVTDETFRRELQAAGNRPVLVDFWAEWCGPCHRVAPVLDQLAAESNGRYVIAKLNVDENPRTAAEFRVQSIPTLLIFRNGALVDRMVGAQSKQAIAARLN